MGKEPPSHQAKAPPIYSPTPCRSRGSGLFHKFIEQSRNASGIDQPRTSKIPAEESAPAREEVEESPDSPEDRPTSSKSRRARKPAGEKVAKRKEPPAEAEENCQVEKKRKTAAGALQELSKKPRKTTTKTIPAPSAAVVAVDDFVSEGHGNGRPQRARCPVLASWRGEKAIYSREPGSATPRVTGFHIVPESQGSKAPRGEVLLIQGKPEPLPGARARPKPARRPSHRKGTESVADLPGLECSEALPDPDLAADEPSSLLPHHTKMPTKSLLRSKGSARRTRKVSWSEEQREFVIEKVPFSTDLWEPVEPQTQCNHCQRIFLWGSEIDYGNFAAARENRFEEVFCKGCRATSLFASIGGWFLVSCACREAGFSADPSEAMMLVQQLIKLGPHGREPDDVWRILRLEEAPAWYEIMQKALARIEEAFTIPEDFEGGPSVQLLEPESEIHEVEDTDVGTPAEDARVLDHLES